MDRNLGFYWSPNTDKLQAQLDVLVDTGANTVFIPHRQVSASLLDILRVHGIGVFVDRGLFAGEELRQKFPDSVPIDAAGLPFDCDGWYVPVCPNHPQVRRHHLEAIADLLDQHAADIDALWLDFIRFPVRWEGQAPNLRPLCFCKHCLNNFLHADHEAYSQEETTTIARDILHERFAEWVAWKCRRIADFVQEIRTQITSRSDRLRLGLFALPWRRTDFDGAIRNVVGQDLALLAPDIDSFSPMVYHQLCYQPPGWIASVVSDHAAWTHRPMLPIIQSVHQPDTMTPDELDAALAHALKASPHGAMIFTLDPLLASNELTAVVRRHFTENVA